jgi:hypothetical protein
VYAHGKKKARLILAGNNHDTNMGICYSILRSPVSKLPITSSCRIAHTTTKSAPKLIILDYYKQLVSHNCWRRDQSTRVKNMSWQTKQSAAQSKKKIAAADGKAERTTAVPSLRSGRTEPTQHQTTRAAPQHSSDVHANYCDPIPNATHPFPPFARLGKSILCVRLTRR